MKPLRIKSFNPISACLFLLLLSIASRVQPFTSLQSDEAVDGVRMLIADRGLIMEGVPKLLVTFHNISNDNITLNLGTIGGGGPRPCKLNNRNIVCTFNFNLKVIDASGVTRKFEFKGAQYVAGRLDPYIISLQAHSTYELELGIDQFWSPATQEYELKFAPGSHEVSLQFEGRVPGIVNLDQPDIKKVSFWKGKLRSNTLAIVIAPARSRTSG